MFGGDFQLPDGCKKTLGAAIGDRQN